MQRSFFGFGEKVFLVVLILFLALAGFFMTYQYQREKTYKIELLDTKLQDFNNDCFESIDTLNVEAFQTFLIKHPMDKLRLTAIFPNGKVLFDNDTISTNLENHKNRKEVREAIAYGKGNDINRRSRTLGEKFFYSATYFHGKAQGQDIIIRSALPYDVSLGKSLKADPTYIWVTLVVTIILAILLFRFSKRLGRNILALRTFAKNAEQGTETDVIAREKFSNDELGEISRYVMNLYVQLKESEEDKARLKRQLTQNIAHELKTPVSSIQGYLETIVNNESTMDETTRHRFLSHCYAQSERLANLLSDISVLNRLDDGQENIETSKIDISKMVKDIVSETSLQMTQNHITFNNLLPKSLIIEGNVSLVYSIFRNLTDNAIAYAGKNVNITLKCADDTDNDFYHFTFYDNGVGVPEEHLPHLFERFYRVDKGRSRKLGGTGLGLAIVKNAVIFHGGTIRVYSQVGGGLAFDFSLKKEMEK
jgi:signal transduction histidine kinase